jgi:NAD(P)-dependent dehydrogenase (short-subunit alcohol dehydrogenase family)
MTAVGPDGAPAAAFSLVGCRAWVTGASRGLGEAAALALAGAGADVALTARTEDQLRRVAESVEKSGRSALVLPASVENADEVAAAAAAIRAEWSGLDVLVNCAGVSPVFKPADTMSPEEWRHIIDVNLSGTFFCAQQAGALMAPTGGAIVNVSSVHASVAGPRLSAYSASKGGVEALTRTLAVEWADRHVRVNALALGYFETDMTAGLRNSERWRDFVIDRIPVNRFGYPHEIMSSVVFLASPASSYMTGSVLHVDGGWSAQ